MKEYTLHLTKQELEKIEEALYARSSLLYAIGDQLFDKDKREEANGFDSRARLLEKLAAKVVFPLDQEYIQTFRTTFSESTKENNDEQKQESVEESVQQGGSNVG